MQCDRITDSDATMIPASRGIHAAPAYSPCTVAGGYASGQSSHVDGFAPRTDETIASAYSFSLSYSFTAFARADANYRGNARDGHREEKRTSLLLFCSFPFWFCQKHENKRRTSHEHQSDSRRLRVERLQHHRKDKVAIDFPKAAARSWGGNCGNDYYYYYSDRQVTALTADRRLDLH
eukprot:GHVU01035066.1.p1 GENE.GHVU01035066.1~~GHVU01035066.1.p1  ORF type:complete len:178 (-),score=15.11 GHVU01035066.1:3448-3981(-)